MAVIHKTSAEWLHEATELLADSKGAWDGEEESVKDEHNGLLSDLEIFFDRWNQRPSPPTGVVSPIDALKALLPFIDHEIEQRKSGGNDEDWAELDAACKAAHDAIRFEETGVVLNRDPG